MTAANPQPTGSFVGSLSYPLTGRGSQACLRYSSASRQSIWQLWQRIGPFTTDLGREVSATGAEETGGIGNLVEITSSDYTVAGFLQQQMHLLASQEILFHGCPNDFNKKLGVIADHPV
jgi:hypothetical protein